MEIATCFFVGIVNNWYFESTLIHDAIGLPILHGSDCLGGLVSLNYFGTIMRAMSYFVATLLVLTRSKANFPLPFTWIFNDLKMFILEPYSLRIFREYVKQMEPKFLKPLDDVLLAYLESFEKSITYGNLSFDSKSSNDSSRISRKEHIRGNLEIIDEVFKRFKKTVAFHNLYLRVKEFETISMQTYD